MNNQVAQAIAGLERFQRTVDDAKALPRVSGEFAHALVLAIRAKRAIEIGTSYGYSGLWIASALAENGGRLITIDSQPHKTEAARERFQQAGLLDRVELRTGDALEVLPSIEGPVDFVLNDADKQNCIAYVEAVADKLSDGAIFLTDNTTTHATELAGFLEWLRRRPDFCTVQVEVGSGMGLSIKRPAG